jgi:hypothetical protein
MSGTAKTSVIESFSELSSACREYETAVKKAHWKADGYESTDDGKFVAWKPQPTDQRELNDWRNEHQQWPVRLFFAIQQLIHQFFQSCPTHLQSVLHPVCAELNEWRDRGYHTFVLESRQRHRVHSATEIHEWEKQGRDLLAKLRLTVPADNTEHIPNQTVQRREAILRVLGKLKPHEGLEGKEILEELPTSPPRLAMSSLRRHYLAPMKRNGQIDNRRGVGYFIPSVYSPRN